MFAFPLTIGAIRAGVMGLYRGSPGPLASAQLGDCLLPVTRRRCCCSAARTTAPAGKTPQALHRAEVDQATGMLAEQLGANITEAFARLRAYSYAQGWRLADDIVARAWGWLPIRPRAASHDRSARRQAAGLRLFFLPPARG